MRYYINSGFFTVLILFFVLPFLEIKCNESKLGSISGYSLITGGDMKMEDSSMMEYVKNSKDFSLLDQQRKKQTDYFSLTSLILLALGAILSLVLKKFREETSVIISVLVICILLAFRSIMLHEWEKQMGSVPDMLSYVRITLNFALGFWLIILGSTIIAALNAYYIILKRRMKSDIIKIDDTESQDLLEEV